MRDEPEEAFEIVLSTVCTAEKGRIAESVNLTRAHTCALLAAEVDPADQPGPMCDGRGNRNQRCAAFFLSSA
jgi:hypothetical protein